MFSPDVKVFASAEELCQAAAALLVELSAAAGGARRLSIALSGGSTPKRLYNIMRDSFPEAAQQSFEYFFGDVRLVPDSSADSNYSMAYASLLSVVDQARVHPIRFPSNVSSPPTADEAPAIEAAVAAFEDELRALVPADDADGVPSLDIVLLGFGPDGHTASLFPGTAAAQESERLAAWCMPGPGIAPQVPRITVTRRIIQAAKNVIVLATGADKAWVVRDIFSEAVENSIVGEAPRSVARLVRNCRGKVTMLLDDKIASGLPQ